MGSVPNLWSVKIANNINLFAHELVKLLFVILFLFIPIFSHASKIRKYLHSCKRKPPVYGNFVNFETIFVNFKSRRPKDIVRNRGFSRGDGRQARTQSVLTDYIPPRHPKKDVLSGYFFGAGVEG